MENAINNEIITGSEVDLKRLQGQEKTKGTLCNEVYRL